MEIDHGVSVFSGLSIHEISKNSKWPNFFSPGDPSLHAYGWLQKKV